MKKIIASLAFFFIFFFTFVSKATANGDYRIENFKSDITLNRDTSVSVTETITSYFFIHKHGIIRVIPAIYSHKGRSINSHLQILSVTDDMDIPLNYTTENYNQSLRIKIGDPDKTIIGFQTYKISYKMRGIILKYDGIPEFYWNVTGHEWDTDILSASVSVTSAYAKPIETVCYKGYPGTKSGNCEQEQNGNIARFAVENITIGSDFTIAVKLEPQNNFAFPGRIENATSGFADNWGYLTAVFPFAIMLYIWSRRGRDDKFVGDNVYYKPDNPKIETAPIFARKHIPLVYHPLDGLSPAQVGTILDERIDINDIVAEIVELARLKYIKIEKLPKKNAFSKQDYGFTLLKKDDTKLNDYQKDILKEVFRNQVKSGSVFEVAKLIKDTMEEEKALKDIIGKDYSTLSSLKNHFYAALPIIKNKVYKTLSEAGVFDGNPDSVRTKYILLYFVLVGIGGYLTFSYANAYYNYIPLAVGVIFDVVGFVFAYSMPKKTAWGYSLNRQVIGLREYLKIGKWREEHYEKHLFFEEMVPLAISLGVIGELAKDMNELGIEPPRYMNGFVLSHFASDIGNFRTTAASTFVSTPGGSGRSSWGGGSGFSGGGGGGFGGGGGGSW